MTRLRKMMLEELQRRNYSAITTRSSQTTSPPQLQRASTARRGYIGFHSEDAFHG